MPLCKELHLLITNGVEVAARTNLADTNISPLLEKGEKLLSIIHGQIVPFQHIE